MRAACLLALGAGLLLSGPAGAQTDPRVPRDDLTANLTTALGVLLPGYIEPVDAPANVSKNGTDLTVDVPVKGADVPLKAKLRPDKAGAWTVLSMTLPAEGTLISGGGPVRHYAIGRQSIRGRLDPTLATPSAGEAALENVRTTSEVGDMRSLETVARSETRAELSPDAAGLLDLTSRATLSGISISLRRGDTVVMSTQTAGATMRSELSGLEPEHLRAFREKYDAVPSLLAANPPPDWRDRLRGLLDAVPGTMQRASFDETANGSRLQFGNIALSFGRQQITASAAAHDDRVDTALLLDLDGIGVSSAPAELAMFAPHHLRIRPVLTGLPAEQLRALAKMALAPGVGPVALRQQALALLQAPGAKVSLESISFDTGPLSVQGSGALRPTASGQLGGELWLRGRGMDALLAQAQADPKMQRMLVGVLLLKGIGRPDGDALVWDVVFGDGPVLVNGIPLVQPPAPRP